MSKSIQESNKLRVLDKLFQIVLEMTLEQQFNLLNKLVKDNISDHLFKSIIELPEENRLELLSYLENLASKTSGDRKHERKSLKTSIEFAYEGKAYSSSIQNLSACGSFIETNQSFAIGQTIIMTFTLPTYEKPVKMTGKIKRKEPNGIGVEFENLTVYLETMLKKAIDQI